MERTHADGIVAEAVHEANRLRSRADGGGLGAWTALWQRLASGGPPPASVAEAVAAVDALLGHPSQRLAAYGTLRPGEENHHLVAGLGTWRPGWVRGRLGEWEGYPVLRPGTARVPVMVLTSAFLADHLALLDDFEGPAYRRAWVVVEPGADDGSGAPQVAQCYVAA